MSGVKVWTCPLALSIRVILQENLGVFPPIFAPGESKSQITLSLNWKWKSFLLCLGPCRMSVSATGFGTNSEAACLAVFWRVKLLVHFFLGGLLRRILGPEFRREDQNQRKNGR